MEQLLEFLTNHLVLTASFFAIVGLLVGSFFYPGARGVQKVSPSEATRLMNQEDAVVVDVRGDGEFQDGHIINAVHIPGRTLSDQIGKLEKFRKKPIITACRTGHQSASACVTLRRQGFERVYNLRGGMLAWENANLPVTKK